MLQNSPKRMYLQAGFVCGILYFFLQVLNMLGILYPSIYLNPYFPVVLIGWLASGVGTFATLIHVLRSKGFFLAFWLGLVTLLFWVAEYMYLLAAIFYGTEYHDQIFTGIDYITISLCLLCALSLLRGINKQQPFFSAIILYFIILQTFVLADSIWEFAPELTASIFDTGMTVLLIFFFYQKSKKINDLQDKILDQ